MMMCFRSKHCLWVLCVLCVLCVRLYFNKIEAKISNATQADSMTQNTQTLWQRSPNALPKTSCFFMFLLTCWNQGVGPHVSQSTRSKGEGEAHTTNEEPRGLGQQDGAGTAGDQERSGWIKCGRSCQVTNYTVIRRYTTYWILLTGISRDGLLIFHQN